MVLGCKVKSNLIESNLQDNFDKEIKKYWKFVCQAAYLISQSHDRIKQFAL